MQPSLILTRSFGWPMDSPYLLGYDWCTYHSQLYKGCCRTRIRSFQAGAISMQQERTWHAIQRPVLSAHGLSAGLRVEWKRTRRSALRHSRPQCKLLPSRACLKADGLLVARARGHKERASNLWMARAGRNQEKHPMCTRLLSSSCFSAPSTLTLPFSSCTR